MISTIKPMLFEIHGEIAGCYHSSTIGHKTGSIHIPDQCINYRHTCATLSPSLDCVHICFPVIISSVIDTVRAKDFCSIFKAPVPVEISPKELIDIYLSRFVLSFFIFEFLCFKVYIPWGECSTCEPRWKFRWIIWAYQLISRSRILTNSLCVPYIFLTSL